MIPENIKTRILPHGRLREQIKVVKKIIVDNPDSEYSKSVLQSLRKKFWFGAKQVTYEFLYIESWNKIIHDRNIDLIEINGLKFINDYALMPELTDIFLADKMQNFIMLEGEANIAKEILSILSVEGPYQTKDVKLKKNDIVIDAGANMGLFSVLASKLGAAKIYSFEPQKSVIELFLKKNILLNYASDVITIVPFGLSDKCGEVELSHSNGHSAASIVLKRNNNNDSETISCITLDHWVEENHIPRIDFIKADIEGAERNMLRGATNVLKKFAPRLAICTYHLPDDPYVLEKIILKANNKYIIKHTSHKLFAYVQ